MNIGMNTVRLLGVVQLLVLAFGILGGELLRSVIGSGSMSDILVRVSENQTRMRISNMAWLIVSVAIVVLGVLFYIVFNEEYRIIALVALGCFLAEAIILAVSKIGTYALIPLSQEFVEAGAPESSYFQTLGDFFYYGLDKLGFDIHMLFFCLGGILWYYLFYVSGNIPRALSVWGLAAVSLLLITTLLVLFNRDLRDSPVMVLGLPYLPFELFLGVWLIVKGFT
jgi:hypothetical protein